MSRKEHKCMEDYDEKFIDSLDSSIYFRFCSGNINAEEFRQSRLEFENDNVKPNAQVEYCKQQNENKDIRKDYILR